jgi:hypothetical protein
MNNVSSKKGYAWLIGTICMVLAIVLLLVYGYDLNWRVDKSWVGIIFIYYLIIFAGAILGLVRGIKELKHQNKTLGILGIIISLLAMFSSILIGLWIELSIFVSTT